MQHHANVVVVPLFCSAILLLLSACGGVTTTQVSGTPAAVSPFLGAWQSTDKDSSQQTLAITPKGAGFTVIYEDKLATVCSGRPATASGPGTVANNKLSVTLKTDCVNPKTFWGNAPYIFTYAQGADTLTDNFSITWHRVSWFVGYWESTDKDRSQQTMFITADAAVLDLAYYDNAATVCSGKPASATGTGNPSGSTLSTTFTVNCLNPQKLWGTAPYTFTYHLATDTLTDGFAITWHRMIPV